MGHWWSKNRWFDRLDWFSDCRVAVYARWLFRDNLHGIFIGAREVLKHGLPTRHANNVLLFLQRKKGRFELRTSTEDLAASIATAGELGVIAVAAVDLVHLATELFVHQGHPAPVAEEAGLVPVLILVRQILETIRQELSLFEVLIIAVPVERHAKGQLVDFDEQQKMLTLRDKASGAL